MSEIQPCPICGCCVLEEDKHRLADYASLLARHNALRHNAKVIIKAYRENRKKYNALRDAVAWERECRDANMGGVISYATHHLWLTHGEDYLDAIQEDYEAICDAARAEVDRLIAEGEG